MEFTHQNLNKDFLTGDFGNNKKDQFADFMSIVDQKYEDDRKNGMKKEKPQTVTNLILEAEKPDKPEKIKKI